MDDTIRSEKSVATDVATTPKSLPPLFTFSEANLKQEIIKEFQKFSKDTQITSDTESVKQILSAVVQICQAKDKEEFKAACTGFVRKYREYDLPYGDYKNSSQKEFGLRTTPLLWTNKGLNKSSDSDGIGNRDLLKEERYLDYISDTDSPPFRLLWSIVPSLLKNSDTLTDKMQFDTTYLHQIREQQKQPLFNAPGKSHIPYDKPLSEVWTEEIPEMLRVAGKTLIDVKIEVGQNNPKFCGTGVKGDSVFCQSELPIFLRIVAEHNLAVEKGEIKEEAVALTNIISTENPKRMSGHKRISTSLKIADMLTSVASKVREHGERQKLPTEESYKAIKIFLPRESHATQHSILSLQVLSSTLTIPSTSGMPPSPLAQTTQVQKKSSLASTFSVPQTSSSILDSNSNPNSSLLATPSSRSSSVSSNSGDKDM